MLINRTVQWALLVAAGASFACLASVEITWAQQESAAALPQGTEQALLDLTQRLQALERILYLAGLAVVLLGSLYMVWRRLRPTALSGRALVLRDSSGRERVHISAEQIGRAHV